MSRSASATALQPNGGENNSPVLGQAAAQGGPREEEPLHNLQNVLVVKESRRAAPAPRQLSRTEKVALAMEAEIERADCREMVRDVTHAFLPTRGALNGGDARGAALPPARELNEWGEEGAEGDAEGTEADEVDIEPPSPASSRAEETPQAGRSARGALPDAPALEGDGGCAREGAGGGSSSGLQPFCSGRSVGSELTPKTTKSHKLAVEAAIMARRSDMLQVWLPRVPRVPQLAQQGAMLRPGWYLPSVEWRSPVQLAAAPYRGTLPAAPRRCNLPLRPAAGAFDDERRPKPAPEQWRDAPRPRRLPR
eukprot:5209581-Prymnesium_polylepis.1